MDHSVTTSVRREQGFTLVEILVVILVIGILAAIAIPNFISQRGKGQDACAKTQLRTALTAASALRIDQPTTGITLALLNRQDRAVPTTATGGCPGSSAFAILSGSTINANCNLGAPTGPSYCIRVTSPSRIRYRIVRAADGTTTRDCYVPAGVNRAGCAVGNTW